MALCLRFRGVFFFFFFFDVSKKTGNFACNQPGKRRTRINRRVRLTVTVTRHTLSGKSVLPGKFCSSPGWRRTRIAVNVFYDRLLRIRVSTSLERSVEKLARSGIRRDITAYNSREYQLPTCANLQIPSKSFRPCNSIRFTLGKPMFTLNNIRFSKLLKPCSKRVSNKILTWDNQRYKQF